MFLPIQLIPYVRLVRRLFSGPGSLRSIAYQLDILCPEEKVTIPPAVFLPGQIDRVTTDRIKDPWIPTVTSETEIAAAISTTVTHAPTIAYHIKDAVLFDGSIYAGRYRYPFYPLGDNSVFVSQTRTSYHMDTGALASTYLGARYFFHWLADDCTRYLLAQEVARPVCTRTSAFSHQQKYQTYFGQDWTPIDRAHIDRLIVFQDFGQNSHKRKRYKILRDRIASHFPNSDRRAYIYLRRGKSGSPRVIQNEDEIVNVLMKRDFVIIDIASDNLDHIIGTLVNAKLVVSMEGSHVAHCIYAAPANSALLVLQPPDRFSAIHRSWSECLGIRFGFIVGAVGDAGYYFSISEILLTIDLLLKSIEL